VRVSQYFLCREGNRLPWGWGIAWYELWSAHAVVLPIPINIVAGWWMRLWWRMQRGVQPDRFREALKDLELLKRSRLRYIDEVRDWQERFFNLERMYEGQRRIILADAIELQCWRTRHFFTPEIEDPHVEFQETLQ
jgi:hypothetical protein